MEHIGYIEALVGEGIDHDAWLTLIASHESLEPVAPRIGLNPFTRKPLALKAPETSAMVVRDSCQVGTIHWAMDDSPTLQVLAEPDSLEAVCRVAESVAAALHGRFRRDPLGASD